MRRCAMLFVALLAGCSSGVSGDTNLDLTSDNALHEVADSASDLGAAGDIGAADLGSLDAGTKDFESTDIGAEDLGTWDGGSVDLGLWDIGTADLGLGDIGITDLVTWDIGTADLGPGDIGTADLGPTDTGPTDVGSSDSSPEDLAAPDVICPLEALIFGEDLTGPLPDDAFSAYSTHPNSDPAWAFDDMYDTGGSTLDKWNSGTAGPYKEKWLQVDFGEDSPPVIQQVCLAQVPSYGANNFQIQGSLDGANFDTLLHVTDDPVDGDMACHPFQSDSPYRYYRLQGTTSASGWWLVIEVEMMSAECSQ